MPKFIHIPQAVFPNQRNDERIFVIARRHYVDFIFFAAAIIILGFVPIILFFATYSTSMSFMSVGVYVRDFFILGALAYYLTLTVLFLTTWIIYYYNIFIVSDERVVEIVQKGLFSREVNELSFEQVVDVSSETKGFLNTLFDAGEIEIQTAGPERNFVFRRISRPHIIVEILIDLAAQAKRGVPYKDRVPGLAIIGSINGRTVAKDGRTYKIMNFSANLFESHAKHHQATAMIKPVTIRQKLDHWWNNHSDQMAAALGKTHAVQSEEDESEMEDARGSEKEDSGG